MGDRRGDLGRAGERAAEEFLRRRRYAILDRNFRCRGGEVDLVALHRGVVVFVEVKTRQSGAAVGPFAAVTPRKQQRIALAARYYLARHRLHGRMARFDVVGVWERADGFACEVIENAFEVRV
jgi:putative endonuclease